MEKLDSQLQEALKRIAELNRELGRDPNDDPLYFSLTDPVRLAADRLLDKVNKSIKEAKNLVGKAEEKHNLAQRILSRAPEDARAEDEKYAREAESDYTEKRRIADIHLNVLNRKKELIASDPKQLFLPLGTHVRINGKGQYQPVTSSFASEVFGEGTEGVVARLNSDSEYPIAVAVVGPYLTSSKTKMNASENRPHITHFDLEQLDVIAPALLPDGSSSDAYGFTATHICEDDDSEEMILEAKGMFWRFKIGWEERDRVELDKAAATLEELDDSLTPINGTSTFKL